LAAAILLLLGLPKWSNGQATDQEPNDTPSGALAFAFPVGSSFGDISTVEDVDYYKFTALAGTEIVIWLRPAADLAPIVAFHDSTGKLLAYNDMEVNIGNGGPVIDPILYIRIPADGNYMISVSCEAKFRRRSSGGTTGRYSLHMFPSVYWSTLSDVYELNNSRSAATQITLPFASSSSNLTYLGDIDWYRFTAKAGDRISIDIEALEPGSHVGWSIIVLPRVGIFDDAGHLLKEVLPAADPDNGFLLDPALVFDAPRDGRYYIAVTSGPDSQYGSIFSNTAFLADPYVSSATHMIGYYQIRVRPLQTLFFPQIANGSYGSVYFSTTVVLVNTANTPATGSISFFNADGTPMEITAAASSETRSQFWFTIPAKSNFVLVTDGSGPGKSGYARVLANGSIGGSAIFSEYATGGSLITEAAVGASTPMDFFTFPVDVTGDFNTGVAIANPEGAEAINVLLNLLDLSGNPVSSTSIPLEAGKQMAVYVSGLGQLFPGLRNFRGSLQVMADIPVPAVALRSSSRTLTAFPAASLNQTYDPVTLYFPQLVVGPSGGSYRSTIVLTNPSYFAVSGTIRFTGSNGSPMPIRFGSAPASATYNFSLAPQGTLFLESNPAESLITGYAVLSADHGLGGVVIYSQFDQSGRLETEAAVPPAPLSENFLIFAQSSGGYNTGVALANVTPTASRLTYLLRDDTEPWNPQQIDPADLEPGKHNATLVSGANQLFPGFSGTGTLEVISAYPIPAVALRLTATTMTAVPVIPIAK
jgi:hypothetical protein